MSEHTPESSAESPSANPSGRIGWLVDQKRGGLLLPATGLWVLALDWVLFTENALALGMATPIVAVVGFVLGSAGTYFFQRRFAEEPRWKAALKSFLAGIVVGVPWPLAGTVVGGWVLLVSGLRKARKDASGK